MANTTPIIHKRTSVSGRLPSIDPANTRYINPGELSINLADKKAIASNGSILFEIGSNLQTLSVTSLIANGSTGGDGQILTTNGTSVYWGGAGGIGFTGSQGFHGSVGWTGSKGEIGVIGFVGSQGVIGFTGSIGAGFTGSIGGLGYSGSLGFTGSRGFTGSQGFAGSAGFNGSVGFAGSQGNAGFTGSVGFTGSAGFNGSVGFVGSASTVAGFSGSVGFTGSKGFNGSAGFTGSASTVAGFNGSVGFTGSKGDKGDFGGASYEYFYSNNTVSTTPAGGILSFNNLNFSAANTLYINFLDQFSANNYNFLQTIDDSTSSIKGSVKLYEEANTLNFVDFSITGLHSTAANSFSVPVAWLTGATSFANNLDVIVTFVRTGDKGDTGNTGFTGSIGGLGYTGSVGFAGSASTVQGFSGSVGFTGSASTVAGFNGSVGFAGSKGFNGSAGFTGSASTVIGFTGSASTVAGFNGSVGFTGSAGTGGAVGFTGSASTVIGFTGSSGSSSAAGTNQQVTFNDSGSSNGSASFVYDKTSTKVTVNNAQIQTKLNVGNPVGFDFGATALVELDGQQNTYVQVVIQNANTGVDASSDLVITNDGGNNSFGYVDLGINSTNYNNADYTVVGAGDAYLYVSDTSLSIGTKAARPVIFHANGTLSTDEAMRITAARNVGIGNTTPSHKLSIGGTLAAGNTTFNGSLTTEGNISASTGSGRVVIGTDSGGSLSLGKVDNTSSSPFIDFNSGATTVDFDVRIAGTGGTGTQGQGTLTISAATTAVTGVLSASLGTAAAPSHTFTGDLNTGMWSPAADTIAFSEGGVEAMRIDSSGNVGIGNTAPTNKLVVAGTAEITAAKEGVFTITDGVTVNLDPNNGSIQTWTLGASRTPSQVNWATGQSITLMIDDGTAYAITWTTLGVVWKTNAGVAPTLATTGFTVIVLWKVGSTIYGARVGDA